MAVIDEKRNFIFIHIFRTGGTSIHRTLDPQRKHHVLGYHCSALHLRDYLASIGKKDFWDNAFKFSIVRNPFDWQVSVYEFLKNGGGEYHEQVKKMTFLQYLNWYEAMMKKGPFHGIGANYFYTQKEALTDNTGKLLTDFTGRFETLAKDWDTISQKIGITTKLPHTNKGKRKSLGSYYRQKVVQSKVLQMFAGDFPFFNYKPHLG